MTLTELGPIVFFVTAMLVVASILGDLSWQWAACATIVFLGWNYVGEPWITRQKRSRKR